MALLATAPACPDAPRLVTSVASVFRADDDAEAVAVRAACVAASREAPAGSRFAFAGFEGMAAKFKEEPTGAPQAGPRPFRDDSRGVR